MSGEGRGIVGLRGVWERGLDIVEFRRGVIDKESDVGIGGACGVWVYGGFEHFGGSGGFCEGLWDRSSSEEAVESFGGPMVENVASACLTFEPEGGHGGGGVVCGGEGRREGLSLQDASGSGPVALAGVGVNCADGNSEARGQGFCGGTGFVKRAQGALVFIREDFAWVGLVQNGLEVIHAGKSGGAGGMWQGQFWTLVERNEVFASAEPPAGRLVSGSAMKGFPRFARWSGCGMCRNQQQTTTHTTMKTNENTNKMDCCDACGNHPNTPNYETKITVHHVQDARKVTADLKIYCGRNRKYCEENETLIWVGMGNPFQMNSEEDRNKVCDSYEEHYAYCIEQSITKAIVRRMAKRLVEGKTIALFCHCAPKRCHADTIRNEALNLAYEQQNSSYGTD